MTPLEALAPAISEVRRYLSLVQSNQWEAPTPCEGWSVRVLSEHLVIGSRMTATLLGGGSRDDAMACFGQTVSTNAAQDFADAVGIEKPAFDRASPDMIVPHPARDLAVSELVGFRLGDYVIHAWDLAQALNVECQLQLELVELVWARLEPMSQMLSQTGMFGAGPSGTVGPEAPLQDRLIDLTGRRLPS
jgi:uncharacterized protein (TIGR03086 family)